jgi:hypothetical protein
MKTKLLLLLVAALMLAGIALSQPILSGLLNAKPAVAGGDGPNTYYDVTTSSDGEITQGPLYMLWNQVSVVTGGTVTKLRIKLGDCTGISGNIKLVLYADAGGAPLASGTVAYTGADSNAYVEVTGLSYSISSGTYKIAFEADVATTYLKTASAGVGYYASQAYSGVPVNPLPSSAGASGEYYLLGLYVD